MSNDRPQNPIYRLDKNTILIYRTATVQKEFNGYFHIMYKTKNKVSETIYVVQRTIEQQLYDSASL